jgi:hypothetical protein
MSPRAIAIPVFFPPESPRASWFSTTVKSGNADASRRQRTGLWSTTTMISAGARLCRRTEFTAAMVSGSRSSRCAHTTTETLSPPCSVLVIATSLPNHRMAFPA